MQRAWITGLTLAGVLGTGGAAFAGMSLTHPDGGAVEAQAAASTLATATATTYRLGDAGLVTLDPAGGTITVTSIVPAAGWIVMSNSGAGVHVEVRLTDNQQVLTLTADLVDGHIVAALDASGVTTVAPDPATAPTPAPATNVVVLTPGTRPAATTAASGSTHSPTSGSTRHESGEREGGEDD